MNKGIDLIDCRLGSQHGINHKKSTPHQPRWPDCACAIEWKEIAGPSQSIPTRRVQTTVKLTRLPSTTFLGVRTWLRQRRAAVFSNLFLQRRDNLFDGYFWHEQPLRKAFAPLCEPAIFGYVGHKLQRNVCH